MDSLFEQTEKNEATQSTKRHKERSKNYPQVPLEKAIEFVKEMKSRVGKRDITNDILAKTYNIKRTNSGAFSSKLAAAKQFGLIEGNGSGMNISELALSLIEPLDDDERASSLRRAFLSPSLYKELVEKFAGDVVPLSLSSILTRKHGISDSAKDLAAGVFLDSAKFAGVQDSQGKLSLTVISESKNDITEQEDVNSLEEFSGTVQTDRSVVHTERHISTIVPGFTSATHQTVSIALTAEKRGFSALPFDATREDIEIMKAMLDVMAMRLKSNSGEAQAA